MKKNYITYEYEPINASLKMYFYVPWILPKGSHYCSLPSAVDGKMDKQRRPRKLHRDKENIVV